MNATLTFEEKHYEMQKRWKRQVREHNLFRDILELEQKAKKLDFWEEETEEESTQDIYTENCLLSEDDDLDPITQGVMLGFIAA